MTNRLRTIILFMALTMTLTATAQIVSEDTTRNYVRIGYYSDTQNTIAGAIDQVTQERMNKRIVTSTLDALSGQAAGVQITTGGNQEAMVSAVRVRGTTSLTGGNDPLVIIDGVTADLATLSAIYPADIESFTILKDASQTAQYGSRGAAGVIEVATKKGLNKKFYMSYDGAMGIESVYKRMNMLNADEFRQAAKSQGIVIADLGSNTDFTRSIERTGLVQNHHIAFGGGSETSNYRASVGVLDHKRVIKTNQYVNYIAKLDITQKILDDRLTFNLGTFGSVQKNHVLPFQQKLMYSASTFNPTFPDGANPDGSYNQIPEAFWISNPNALLQMKQDEDNHHFNVHLNGTLQLTKQLVIKALASYSYSTANNAHYYPTYVWGHGEAYRGNDKKEELRANISLDYTLKTQRSALNLMVLAESESETGSGFFTTVTNFSTDEFGYDELMAGAVRQWGGTDSYYNDSHMESFLLHGQYTLDDKYTLTVNARTDASSKFGRNHRWGFFPSVSGAWVISKEPWMKKLTFINNAKLRMGYGLSGSQGGIDSYNSMLLMRPNGIVPVEGAPAVTLGIVRNANPDLKWEMKHTFNVGLDLLLWNSRIALSIDYYRSKTTDMLYVYDVPVPPFSYNKLLANLGSMKNSGLEIGFGITPLRTHDMELTVNMNWSFERNRLLSLDGYYDGQYLTTSSSTGIAELSGAGFHGGSTVVFQMVGQPLGVFNLPHCKGLKKNPDGTMSYDIEGEAQICGQATPKAMMGSNFAFRYRQWDITVQMNGAFGHKIYNGTALSYMNMRTLPNYNVMKGAPEANIHDQTISDYWLERGDYVNIDYVTIGWEIPLEIKHVNGLRLWASVNNLATITSYSGLTPIINSSVINNTLGVDDKRSLPAYRSYTLGVNIRF